MTVDFDDDWRSYAACQGRDADLFFPERGQSAAAALAVCAGCMVRRPCLSYALSIPRGQDCGVWGGTSEQQRERMRRKRTA